MAHAYLKRSSYEKNPKGFILALLAPVMLIASDTPDVSYRSDLRGSDPNFNANTNYGAPAAYPTYTTPPPPAYPAYTTTPAYTAPVYAPPAYSYPGYGGYGGYNYQFNYDPFPGQRRADEIYRSNQNR